MKHTELEVNRIARRPKYSLEVDCGGAEASGYEDTLPWVCYGTIVAEGDSLEELLECAEVDLVDQDGGERGFVEADADWMQQLIREAFAEKYPPEHKCGPYCGGGWHE